MIEKRTVFILGAGASCPYNFPTTREMRQEILSGFEGRYTEFLGGPSVERQMLKLRKGHPDIPVAKRFLDCFKLSSTDSVDLFLSRNPQFEPVGKIAICLSILHAERGSVFREQVTTPQHDWYRYLLSNLTREATKKYDYCRFGDNRISFVTFNYDRSLEHFLFESLLNSFEGIDEWKVKEQLDKTPAIHVYGRPAPLPWQQDNEREGLPYGVSDLAPVNLLEVISNMYVVHEERLNPELDRARKEIEGTERIFFLGFGYARENLEALGFPGVLKPGHQIYGTAMGLTPGEITNVGQTFLSGLSHRDASSLLAHKQIHIHDCDCVALLRKSL